MEQTGKCMALQWIHITQIFITILLLPESKGQEQVRLSVHQGYTELKWSPIATTGNSGVNYKVFYQVLSTRFHSVIDAPPGVYGVNITTTDYPGSMYIVRLYSIEQGSNHTRVAATRTFRAGCNYKFNVHINDTFTIMSPGFPNGYHSGVLCQWSLMGHTDMWYKITFSDFTLPSGDNCSSYLDLVGYKKYCGVDNAPMADVIPLNNLNIRFYGRKSGKGFNANITAIPVLTAPHNITVISIGQYIHVNWTQEGNAIKQLAYVLKTKVPPNSGNETAVELPWNTSQYDIDTTAHQGQAFSIRMLAKTPYWQSSETDPVVVRADCHHEVMVQGHTQEVIVSPGYPSRILPDVICHWSVSTTDDFYLMFTFNDFMLTDGFDTGCKETYIEIKNYGRKCNLQRNPYDIVVKNKTAALGLHTGTHVKGQGFNITVKAVAKPTAPPGEIHFTVNTTHININWKPPIVRSQEIVNYVIRYDVMPDIPNMEIKTNETFVSISTHDNRGRMYIIRLASETEGGRSLYTRIQYVRAACGVTRIISHRQSMMIFSPSYRGLYRPGVVCKWSIATYRDLLLEITIDRLDVEKSPLCTKDYIQISNGNKLCGYQQNKEILVQSNMTDIMFLSDLSNQLTGFILTVTSVAPPPGHPEQFNVVSSPNALVLSWKPPNLRPNYLTGYIVQYRLTSSGNFTKVHVPVPQNYYVINTENTPGVLYDISVRSNGESKPGPTTVNVIQRSHCGYSIRNLTEPLYITSPHYPLYSTSGTLCKWHLQPDSDFYLTIKDIKVKSSLIGPGNVSDYIIGCLKITGVQNTSVLVDRHVLVRDRDVWIHFNTSEAITEGGFLLQILSTKIANISDWITGNYSTGSVIGPYTDTDPDISKVESSTNILDSATQDFWYTIAPSKTLEHFYSGNDSLALPNNTKGHSLTFGYTVSSLNIGKNGRGYVGNSLVVDATTNTLIISESRKSTFVPSSMNSSSSYPVTLPVSTGYDPMSSASVKSELVSLMYMNVSQYLSTDIRSNMSPSSTDTNRSGVHMTSVQSFTSLNATSVPKSAIDPSSTMIDRETFYINTQMNREEVSILLSDIIEISSVVTPSDSFFGKSVNETASMLQTSDLFSEYGIIETPNAFFRHSDIETLNIVASSDMHFRHNIILTPSLLTPSNSFVRDSVIKTASVLTPSGSFFKDSVIETPSALSPSGSFFKDGVIETPSVLTPSGSFFKDSVIETPSVLTPSCSFFRDSVIETTTALSPSGSFFRDSAIATSNVLTPSDSFLRHSGIKPSSALTPKDSISGESLLALDTLLPSYSIVNSVDIGYRGISISNGRFSKTPSLTSKDFLQTIDPASTFDNKSVTSTFEQNKFTSLEVPKLIDTVVLNSYTSSDITKNGLSSGSLATRSITSHYTEDIINGGTCLKQTIFYNLISYLIYLYIFN